MNFHQSWINFRMEHRKHSPHCAFLNLEVESNRLATFASWPYKGSHASASEVCPQVVHHNTGEAVSDLASRTQ
jgi:hypothetical protein